ncbi:ribonuclease III domain-containing protein [Paecilomyces variotii]|uniref:Ribonuclease III domain-containing protein n=1 Tax=Byssochlamys spectabilis TaxID=264951 RepID=A0A443HJ52_BYSSP|nr:ribonuclease III domain-containing protein [Paecilomyces variotii]KAJ9288257.1 hypothetical protein DTO021C3_4242 [Paecilomyces variotii]KAJ9356546.1 hypothetical protein DTO280E4_6056 [Paecilomyces variotii]RWQ91777.1 ribonuclease III domain-containing protein [Paecilomyces variotii]
MGHKRKAGALSQCLNAGPPEKQSKNHDRPVKIERGATSANALPDTNKIQSLLVELQNLVAEVIKGVGPVQDQLGGVGRDLLKTASQIERRLAQATSTYHCHAGKSSQVTEKAPRTSPEDKATHLPVLPLVRDPALEQAAFRHPGVVKGHEGDTSTLNYDRLEILGDAYLELMATKLIWNRFQNLPSGRISQLRELLVKNETLAEFATLYGFDRRAAVPEENIKQPKRWTKTKGDIFEAYVAAVISSNPTSGYEEVENWLSQLWSPKLDCFLDTKPTLQSKELLAKKIMGKGIKLKYVDERPPVQLLGGMQTFYVGVYLTGWGWENQHLGSGQGLNKAIAGDNAAREALLNKPLIDEIAAAKRAHNNSEAKASGHVDY